jgi:predicted ATPase
LFSAAPKAWAGPEELATIANIIPASLRHMIEQHVVQLPPAEQAILEAASIAGHTFTVAAVAAGSMQPEETIETCCTTWARQARFVHPDGAETWPDGTVTARYSFVHALYHDVVYGRVSAGQRIRLHQQIGMRKEIGYGTQAAAIAAELALHFTQAQDAHRAVVYLQHAASNAIQRAAFSEALSHIAKGLEALEALPDTLERARHELALQTALGSVLSDTKGQIAPEVEQAYVRALELCHQLEDPPEIFSVLYGLGGLYEFRGEYDKAEALYHQRHHMAQRLQDNVLLMGSFEGLACSAFHQGKFAQALEHTEQGLALYDRQHHSALTLRYGRDSGVACHIWASRALWFLGYADQSLRQSHAARRLAQDHAHPFTVALAYNQTAQLHQLRREACEAREWSETVIAQATEQGSPHRMATGTILLGWALAVQGQGEAGIARLRQGLAAYQAGGAAMDTPYFLGLLADAYHRMGLVEEGLGEVTEALGMVRNSRAFFYEAELYRLKGELLLRAAGGVRKAELIPEACFQKAIGVARRQQAKALELRATMSLARLWQSQGKRQEAYELLAPVYGWFTEGFDTADFQEAEGLLDGLSEGRP